MADPRGFLKFSREEPIRRPIENRVHDWCELYEPMGEEKFKTQGVRCMDCGVPFCQSKTGCPVGNLIPEWNDLVNRGRWQDAMKALHATNNFPEFTGRLCPAPCESSCVLGLIDQPVTIRHIEQEIVDRGFSNGWIVPIRPLSQTGKRVAIVGSGPAGLAAAQQLVRAGHTVTVFEKADRVGGLLRYGIPDFKIEKWVLNRRIDQLQAEGVMFQVDIDVGRTISVATLKKEFDAVCLAGGAMVARDLHIPGREFAGVHLAMEYLTQQNRLNQGDDFALGDLITAKDKRVVVIGGGDTGSDCVGTAHRQGAKDVYQYELLPEPPPNRDSSTPWPQWPMKLRTSHAHEEGCNREWSVSTTHLGSINDAVSMLHACRVEFKPDESGRPQMIAISGSEFEIGVDLVLLAMGFIHPERNGLLADLGVTLDSRGNVAVDEQYMTSVSGVFAAGDMKRGASLIVWAIAEGRKAAANIDAFLREGRTCSS
ncbi:MAG: glutamate synthase [Nitrospiraceae bacterium]|nr:glutamate synthase [Nitrospiraceae bacterium]